MSRLMISVVLIVTLCGATGMSVFAQDAPTYYTVTSQQTINARGCPRTSCPVLRTFAPGDQLTVIEVTPGETVLGSDEWLHVDAHGVDVFVHSSLAAPLPASGRDASEDSAPAGSSSGEDTSGAPQDWITHTGTGFSVDVPPTWLNITEVLSDENYLAEVGAFLGEDYEVAIQNLELMCGEGACDLVMADLRGNVGVFIMHLDVKGLPQSAQLWKIMLEEQFKAQGADVLSAEVVELPAGEAARLHLTLTIGVAQLKIEYLVYTVTTDDRLYMLIFYMDSCCVEDSSATIDQVVASFLPETGITIE